MPFPKDSVVTLRGAPMERNQASSLHSGRRCCLKISNPAEPEPRAVSRLPSAIGSKGVRCAHGRICSKQLASVASSSSASCQRPTADVLWHPIPPYRHNILRRFLQHFRCTGPRNTSIAPALVRITVQSPPAFDPSPRPSPSRGEGTFGGGLNGYPGERRQPTHTCRSDRTAGWSGHDALLPVTTTNASRIHYVHEGTFAMGAF
jgi:hypothetical protein